MTITNGCDFDDFDGIAYQPGKRFRITHTGSFFGRRDPRPFLTALADSGSTSRLALSATSGRPTASGPKALGLGDRLELLRFVPRRRALELQRDSEALLLLIPEADGRGQGVLSGKVFEYLATERPILAVVPEDGAAAALIEETGAGVVAPPDDPVAIAAALDALHERWQAGELDGTPLAPSCAGELDRACRECEELADLLQTS